MGVSLWALRCAYAHKVGVLRAALSLRCYAKLRTGLTPPFACLTQAGSKLTLLIQKVIL
ncbi:MAG: hypothetical protein NZ455_00635 [Bacteroidia bacterium]|nr:hypothetical protein [Bacteroidia bacterium]MDW8345412.1 hypothetical protein [Bacteroidia bacterium]